MVRIILKKIIICIWIIIIILSSLSFYAKNLFQKVNKNNNNILKSKINDSNHLLNYISVTRNISLQIDILDNIRSKNNCLMRSYNRVFRHNINYIHYQKKIITRKIIWANASIIKEINILFDMKNIISNHPYNYLELFNSKNYYIPDIYVKNYNKKSALTNKIETISKKIQNNTTSINNISYNAEEVLIGTKSIESLVCGAKLLLISKINFKYNNILYFSQLLNNLTSFSTKNQSYNSIDKNKFIKKLKSKSELYSKNDSNYSYKKSKRNHYQSNKKNIIITASLFFVGIIAAIIVGGRTASKRKLKERCIKSTDQKYNYDDIEFAHIPKRSPIEIFSTDGRTKMFSISPDIEEFQYKPKMVVTQQSDNNLIMPVSVANPFHEGKIITVGNISDSPPEILENMDTLEQKDTLPPLLSPTISSNSQADSAMDIHPNIQNDNHVSRANSLDFKNEGLQLNPEDKPLNTLYIALLLEMPEDMQESSSSSSSDKILAIPENNPLDVLYITLLLDMNEDVRESSSSSDEMPDILEAKIEALYSKIHHTHSTKGKQLYEFSKNEKKSELIDVTKQVELINKFEQDPKIIKMKYLRDLYSKRYYINQISLRYFRSQVSSFMYQRHLSYLEGGKGPNSLHIFDYIKRKLDVTENSSISVEEKFEARVAIRGVTAFKERKRVLHGITMMQNGWFQKSGTQLIRNFSYNKITSTEKTIIASNFRKLDNIKSLIPEGYPPEIYYKMLLQNSEHSMDEIKTDYELSQVDKFIINEIFCDLRELVDTFKSFIRIKEKIIPRGRIRKGIPNFPNEFSKSCIIRDNFCGVGHTEITERLVFESLKALYH